MTKDKPTNTDVVAGNIKTSFISKLKNYLPKKLFPFGYIVIGIILLAIILSALYINRDSLGYKTQCTGRSSSPIYQKAATALKNPRAIQLEEVVNEIKSQRSFDKDPNCLYPVVAYYVYTQDITNANKYLDLLQVSYGKRSGFAEVYSETGFPTLEKLQVGVAELAKVIEDRKGFNVDASFF